MRHRRKINHLSRKSAHRKAMLSNMAASLIMHKRITTTLAKAKALQTYIEPLITKSKVDTTHSRRIVFGYLQSKDAVTELFRDISVKVADRPGGYTRIIKTGTRLGDNAEMCMMELVDFNETMLAEKGASKPSRRKRRGGKKTTETVAATAAVAAKVEDTPAKEEVADEVEATVDETKAEVVEELKTEVEVIEEAKAEVTETIEEVKTEVKEEIVAETEPDAPEEEDSKGDDDKEKKE